MPQETLHDDTKLSSRLLVANIKGSNRQRGELYGELFGEKARQSGIIDFYNNYCEEIIANSSYLQRAFIRFVYALYARRHSPNVKELIQGFCATSGIPEGYVRRGLVMPDVLNLLIGLTGKLASLPSLGCISVAVCGDYTSTGEFLYARNLDFAGNGIWDRFPLVTRCHPDQGIPYVSIGTAGSLLDGITGINEEGLTVALHQHLSREVGLFWKVRPVLDLASQVLQFAKDIDEALVICSSWKLNSGWSLVLTNWKKRESCAIEMTNASFSAIHSTNGKMVRTNDFTDPGLKAKEINYGCYRESSRLRAARADQLVEENKGRVDCRALACLLSDHLDMERNKIRAIGQTIAQPHNMTSVVFEPEKGIMWVSEGEAPVFQGPYRKVSLWEERQPEELLGGINTLASQNQRKAYGHYLEAYMSWIASHDTKKILEKLGQAIEEDANEPIYRYMCGLFALKAHRFKEALESFEVAASMPDIKQRSQAERLWQARTLDLLERRGEAIQIHKELLWQIPITRSLKRAAEKGLKLAYSSADVKKIQPDFVYGDVFRF